MTKINTILNQANSLPNGHTRIELIEQAIKLADSGKDLHGAYRARYQLFLSAREIGQGYKAIVAFGWCLAQCDAHPDRFSESSILWQYKSVINHACTNPDITLSQLQGLLDDMAMRYQRNGAGLFPVYDLRINYEIRMGFFEQARQSRWRRRQEVRKGMENCAACRCDDEVVEAIYLDQDDIKALKTAQPLLDGRLSCTEVPLVTYPRLLLPLLRLGRYDQALEYFHHAYPGILRLNSGMLFYVGMEFRFACIAGLHTKADRLFEKHFANAVTTYDYENKFQFYLPSITYLDIKLNAGRHFLALTLPKKLKSLQTSNGVESSALKSWLQEQLIPIAARFDERNGNNFFGSRLKELEEDRMWADSIAKWLDK